MFGEDIEHVMKFIHIALPLTGSNDNGVSHAATTTTTSS
jgi:hypothetical protein